MKIKLLTALIALAALTSCNSENNKHEENEHEKGGGEGIVILNKNQQKALDLKLGSLQMRNLRSVVKVNGQLRVPPSSKADITAIIGGNVKDINVFHGDKVKKGQLLAVLEHPNYIIMQEDFAEAAINLEFLKLEYDRQKQLFENNVGSGRDFQKVKADYNAAKIKYAGLESRLKLLNISPDKVKSGLVSSTIKIISPITGYVNDININVGTYIGAKDKLFTITDNHAIHADFIIYEKDAHLVEEGQVVQFKISNIPDQELTAKVFAIGKEFETNNRFIEIHASIESHNITLIDGMYISGFLNTDSNYTNTLPDDAVVTEGTKSYIFIYEEQAELIQHRNDEDEEHNHNSNSVDNDETKRFRMIEIIRGLSMDGYTEINLIDSMPPNTLIVLNAAYYLLADLNKEETGDEH
ncbi:MAG: efflux transporter periplasmic adaptor subunit [Bacteroidetes bacterium]|nr:efflux transporter periplasmic adaptor subunit [Bacteroidota bacterium]